MTTQFVPSAPNDLPLQGIGQRGRENGIRNHLPTVRDRVATLECDVLRLNAVAPNFNQVDKSVKSVFVATRWLAKAFDTAIASATREEKNRSELTLEAAYRMVLDLDRGVPTVHHTMAIDDHIKKSKDPIRDAYNRVPELYSMQPEEIVVYRSLWAYTALALRRCAIQPYRHTQGRQVFDLRVKKDLNDNDTYYLARVLASKMALSDPKYHINSSCFEELQIKFEAILKDLDAVIEAMRRYRSAPALQTIERRDRLVGALKIISGALRDTEIAARMAFAERPAICWKMSGIFEIDPYDPKYQ